MARSAKMHVRLGKNIARFKNARTHCSVAGNVKFTEVNEPLPRPFKDIPGPKALPVIGTLYKYVPIFGEYSFEKLHKTGLKKYKQYGPLVKEEIVPGVPTVWVYRPEDIETIFKIDYNRHPERRSHLALYKYRKDRSSIYNSGGLLPTNGVEWWRLRKEFQKALSRPKSVISYLTSADKVIQDFTEICKKKENYLDFMPMLSRVFLELICLVAFDVTFNSFSKNEMDENSRSTRLIDAALTTNSVVLRLDNGPMLWRYFDTPLYKKLCKAQSFMEEIAIEMVSNKMHEMESCPSKSEGSLLEAYLKNPEVDQKDIIGMACDMLLAGMDTTSYTSAFALYYLGRNKHCQEALYNEAVSLLDKPNSPITVDILKKATYTKAVLKETFRLNPISVGIGRILQTDTVLNGFHVPKGVVVVTQNQIICRLPEYFEDPEMFLPQRWLRMSKNDAKTNPYLILPFGHGPRSCIARRLAEQNMQVLLLRLSRNFTFTWKGGQLDSRSLLINKPDSPIHLKLEQRS